MAGWVSLLGQLRRVTFFQQDSKQLRILQQTPSYEPESGGLLTHLFGFPYMLMVSCETIILMVVAIRPSAQIHGDILKQSK